MTVVAIVLAAINLFFAAVLGENSRPVWGSLHALAAAFLIHVYVIG